MKLTEIIDKKTLVIAEIGCNHNGDVNIAKDLIEAAVQAGADVAKFQSFDPKEMILPDAPKAEYQIRATGTSESQFDRLVRLRLSKHEQRELRDFCEQRGILFCSSAFDEKSADFLNTLNPPFFKIASGEITNLPLLEQIGSFGRPVILSTGMSNLGEIETALEAIRRGGNVEIALLHCVSSYPTMWEEANLKAIRTLRRAFNLPAGLSDHSEGIELSLVAVGMQARIIEKHITLDKDMEGGDHRASLEPDEFGELVRKIRKVEVALGNGTKRCMPSEMNVRDVARKSIVTRRDIKAGRVILREDVGTMRPGNGIPPSFLGMVVGSRAKEDIEAFEAIHWRQIEIVEK